MEQDELRTWEHKCIQEEPPECTATCPIHVDARAFVREMGRGDREAAFDVLARTMPFPGILARICDHPCEGRCKRGDVDQPIAIGLLERACAGSATGTAKSQLLPRRPQRIAVVGGGLAGMTAAWDLRKKGFGVTLLERADRLGGSLWEFPEGLLPREVILAEIARLEAAKVEVRLSEALYPARFEELRAEYSAVFVDREAAEGLELPLECGADGAIEVDPASGATSRNGVYAGGGTGGVGNYSPVNETFQGRRGALSIERFLQRAAMAAGRGNEGTFETRLVTSIEGVAAAARTVPGDAEAGYSEEEVRAESARCIQCECMECAKVCLYIERYAAYPKKYARQVFANERVVLGAARTKNQFVNSCSECGLCEAVCPNGFHLGDLCADARRTMVEQRLMPASFHEFALLDMAHSNGEHSALVRNEPGRSESAWLYFPSCQLTATSPGEVLASYAYLRERLSGGVGIALGCCGVPADWAGRDDLFATALGDLRRSWESMGRPRLITACSNCLKIFRQHLPESSPTSIWSVLEDFGLPRTQCVASGSTVAIADPCNARYDHETQDAVRRIVRSLGMAIEELPLRGDTAECCGYGGLMYNANPGLAADVIAHRVSSGERTDAPAAETPFKPPTGWHRERLQEGADTAYYHAAASDRDYIAYCAMCRDNFAGAGKRVSHLIELLFPAVEGADPAARGWISWSERRENRERVRQGVLREFGDEEGAGGVEAEERIALEMTDEVRRTIDERRILEEDVRAVIEHAEQTGERLLNNENGHLLAYRKLGNVTFWVDYTVDDDRVTVHNAYSHRMKIAGVKR